MRRSLGDGTALLEYFLLSDRLVVFLVRAEGITAATHETRRDALASRIRVARELTGRPASGAGMHSALEALHDVLIGDHRRRGGLAGIHTLFVVPDAELEYVPFAAMRDASSGRYLIEDFALLNLPSAAVLPILRNRIGTAAGGTGVRAFAPFPKELPGSRDETMALSRMLPGATVETGSRASESSLRAALASASIVHVATHGIMNARNPLFSRIELSPGAATGFADDGRLEVHEVNRMEIRASLVFLSGCETGLGLAGTTAFHQGEDYATLTRAFLTAGASNVIATLWRVGDRGAAAFAEQFYRELDTSEHRGEANHERLARVLSRAQREMLRSRAWAAPFYWAGFRLSGTGDGPPAKTGSPVRS